MKIYQPKGRAREYSPWALNYFSGCDHGCSYCYVPNMMKWFNPMYDHSNVVSKYIGDIQAEAGRFSRTKNKDEQIMLSFTTDPYCKYESGQTRIVLDAMHNYDLHVSVLTKNPEKALRDIDVMKHIKHIKVGTTITTTNDDDSLKWEPGAPLPKSRISALEEMSKHGIKTWVSFEPVLYPEQTLEAIMLVKPFIDHVKIGKLNNHPHEKNIDWREFSRAAITMCRENDIPFYVKKDLSTYVTTKLSREESDQDYYNV